MRRSYPLVIALLTVFSITFAGDAFAKRDKPRDGSKKSKDGETTVAAKKGDKAFETMIKDKVVVEGLFTFYKDTVENTWLMSLKPDQFGPVYLCGQTRSASAGAFYDNASMGRTFPFYLKRVGKKIMLMEKNLRFRADSSATLARALERAVSDHLWASATIKSDPEDSTEAILIDPAELFLRDVANSGYFLNRGRKTGISFDKDNSYFEQVKSFPHNTEIDIRQHFKTKTPVSRNTMQNPYSLFHLYHFSLSSLPETDYVPRLADDRIGHFLTMYQDYTNLDETTPYVRYVDRWNLKKQYPDSAMSEPVEPIVYWVDNAVPEEYRDVMKEAIEFWNPAFEKIGFKNAIVAKQMPDTADWDPADSRYNVIRWMINPGSSYAVGPSRANPFTGQIYDADIRFSVDWIRGMYNLMERWIAPISFDGRTEEHHHQPWVDEDGAVWRPLCNIGDHMAEEGAFAVSYLASATSDLADKDSVTQVFVRDYLREIVAHEVGHTLGFRHNFKASTIYSLEQVNDPEFTRDHALTGTIMDYVSANLAGPGKEQGDFYSRIPGVFDDWMVEYAYTDFGATVPEDEIDQLKAIADKAGQPDLIYGTDEDAFGWSSKSIDPYANLHDLGDDPLGFAEHKIALSRELWHNSMGDFEKPGGRYQDVFRAFLTGWRSYREMALIAPKYVGGMQRYNHHIGDPGGRIPFEVVPAADQRRAVAALKDKLFAADAFDLPADLMNKLQPERYPDFSFSVYRVPQVDYPLHQMVLATQRIALVRLYHPLAIGRLLNNTLRVQPDEDNYTMYDMFTEVRRSIWGEIVAPENVNSFRRQLQLLHLEMIAGVYLSDIGAYPADARSLAADNLEILLRAAKRAVGATGLDDMTRAHFKEVVRRIEATFEADRDFASSRGFKR